MQFCLYEIFQIGEFTETENRLVWLRCREGVVGAGYRECLLSGYMVPSCTICGNDTEVWLNSVNVQNIIEVHTLKQFILYMSFALIKKETKTKENKQYGGRDWLQCISSLLNVNGGESIERPKLASG